jgi:hypothetical protein
LGFATAFRTAGAVFFAFGFAAFTSAGRCFRDAVTLALRRFAAGLRFGLSASAFFAFSSCQRFFWASAIRCLAAALNRFLPVAFGSELSVAVEMDRLGPPWPNSAWI